MHNVMLAATEGVNLTEVLVSSFTDMIADCMASIAAIVPIVLPLLGASIVVAYGIKTFKRVTGKA